MNGTSLEIEESFLESNSLEEAIGILYNNPAFIELLQETLIEETEKNERTKPFESSFANKTKQQIVVEGLQGNYSIRTLVNSVGRNFDNIRVLADKLTDLGLNIMDNNIFYSPTVKEETIFTPNRNFYIFNDNTYQNPTKLQNLLVSLYITNNNNENNYMDFINKVLNINDLDNKDIMEIINNIKSSENVFKEFINYSINNSQFQNYLRDTDQWTDLLQYINAEFADSYYYGKLEPQDYTNHSGGAYGADTDWDLIGREFGVTNHIHYRPPKWTNVSKRLQNIKVRPKILSASQMDPAFDVLEQTFRTKFDRTSLIDQLKARNYYQVQNADEVFAIANLNKDRQGVNGGTNYAVQMSIYLEKPVHVYDLGTNKWYKWNGMIFDVENTPTLTRNFAGIGSRDIEIYEKQTPGKYVGPTIENSAKQAIRDVYSKTFGRQIIEVSNTEKIETNIDSSFDTNGIKPLSKKEVLNIIDSNALNTLEFKVLTDIINGQKFKWSDKIGIGVGNSTGLTNSNTERSLRLNLLDNTNGLTPERYAEITSEENPQWNYDEVLTAINDALRIVTSPSKALARINELLTRSGIIEKKIDSSKFIVEQYEDGVIINYDADSVFVETNANNWFELLHQLYPMTPSHKLKGTVNLIKNTLNQDKLISLFTDIKCKS